MGRNIALCELDQDLARVGNRVGIVGQEHMLLALTQVEGQCVSYNKSTIICLCTGL